MFTKINNFMITNVLNINSYIFLPCMLLLYRYSYKGVNKLLQNNSLYDTLSTERKNYIIFNISKACMLSYISYLIMLGYNRNILRITSVEWHHQTLLKNITGLYAITDIVPLFVDRKKMMTSTVIHHVCVALAVTGILNSNLENIGLSNAIIIYGLFSSLAFIVNGYLGSRFLIKNKTILKYIKKITFMVYIMCCSVNWSIQSVYLSSYMKKLYMSYIKQTSNISDFTYLPLYLSFLYFWISDDIILMRYLLK